MSEYVVVRLPLTDEQIEVFVMGSECGNTPDETVRAIGTPVPDSGLKAVDTLLEERVAGKNRWVEKKNHSSESRDRRNAARY